MSAEPRQARPLIVDCDTGIDDALALLFLLRNSGPYRLIGITAVAGNVPLELTAPNCVRVCSLAGRQVPVYAGASGPLYGERHDAEAVHGANGLGGVELPSSYEVSSESALDMLTRSASEHAGSLELLTLGPLTNIALAILTDPGFAARIRRITLMGGALQGGNATAAAEFNIYADPEAARIVFQAGIPLTMIGLDVTNRTLLDHAVVDRWCASPVPAVRGAGRILSGYRPFLDGIAATGTAMHDPLAAAVLADPSLVTTRDLFVDIETKSRIARGKTVADELQVTGRRPNVSAAVDVDVERFLKLFVGTIEGYAGADRGSGIHG